jgi:predicted phage baseplate assembly protein
MPLEDLIPQIDDRRFDDLVTEVRTRIARYAPEWRPGESAWTDVNDNDPGVTFAQVFAWQAEMLLYRLNRVPALNYIKFLQLIGIELQPASPAIAEVTLPAKATAPTPLIPVALRTQLTADPGDGEPLLLFETTRAIMAWRAQLDAVLVRRAGEVNYLPETDANTAADEGFAPFGDPARDGAELALGFVDPSPILPLPLQPGTLDLAVVVLRDAFAAKSLACADAPAYPSATVRWEYWDGARWQGLDLLKDETLAFTRSGHIHVKMPPKGIAAKTRLESDPAAPQRHWIRARLDRSQYERAPRVRAIRLNTVPVEQAETIRDEVLGGSDGSRYQRFTLGSRPVLAHSLTLEIQQSDEGFQPWTEVPDFFGSGPRDNHFVLDRSTGTVLTGDGVNGNIPVAYVRNPDANVVAREYRTGGGRRGNVAAGQIKTLVSHVDGIDENAVGNLLPASGGRDEETLDEVRARAPRVIRSRERAVTAEDYEYFAMQAGNVARAKALALFHPLFPDVQVPGAVSVIVVPDSDDPAPEPSEGLLRTVCACLDSRRTLTAELFVMKPQYQEVSVSVDLIVEDDADVTEVAERLEQSLLDYFHPLRGGDTGQGWPFGGTIFYSKVYQRIFADRDVASISTLVISIDGEERPPCTDVPIAPHALVFSIAHSISARYRVESAS